VLFEVKVTNNTTLSVSDWTDMAVRQLIFVADDAPEPIKAQALAYRDQMHRVVCHIMDQAVEERRSRDAHLAEINGSSITAAAIRGDR
jgi:uncharacterized protein (UPF0254 family)